MTHDSPTAAPSTGWSERGISILNGVVGDYLDRRGNGLAIPMSFVQDGATLVVNSHALQVAQPVLTGKVVVVKAVVYGLISEAEALERYALSQEEFATWRQAIEKHGEKALRVTSLQKYRQL